MPVKAPVVQDTKEIGPVTVTIGTGIAMLTLPDVGSMVTRGPNQSAARFPVVQTYNLADDLNDKVGWAVNGSIAVPVGLATVSLNGFWAQIKGKSSSSCTPVEPASAGDLCVVVPLFDKPSATPPVNGVLGPSNGSFGGQLAINSERTVNQWGAALESKWAINRDFIGLSSPLFRPYWAVGVDVRGIYQKLDATISTTATNSPAFSFVDTYGENLNTTYSGAYLAWGADFSPILPLFRSWGLENAFRLQGGIYYAHTSYSGQLANTGSIIGGGGDPTSALTLSRNDAAFIGGVTLETRKKISSRATLSLKSEYEYYSFVPQMTYNTAVQNNNNPFNGAGRQFGTFIGSNDAFSMRTSLRLTIALGPDELYK